MDIHNTLEVISFPRDIFKAAAKVLEDGKVGPLEVALEGRKLITPAMTAIKEFGDIPKEILDMDMNEYAILESAVEGLVTDARALLAQIKAVKTAAKKK